MFKPTRFHLGMLLTALTATSGCGNKAVPRSSTRAARSAQTAVTPAPAPAPVSASCANPIQFDRVEGEEEIETFEAAFGGDRYAPYELRGVRFYRSVEVAGSSTPIQIALESTTPLLSTSNTEAVHLDERLAVLCQVGDQPAATLDRAYDMSAQFPNSIGTGGTVQSRDYSWVSAEGTVRGTFSMRRSSGTLAQMQAEAERQRQDPTVSVRLVRLGLGAVELRLRKESVLEDGRHVTISAAARYGRIYY